MCCFVPVSRLSAGERRPPILSSARGLSTWRRRPRRSKRHDPRRIDAHTSKIVTKLDGKITITQTLVVSAGAKTLTIRTTGTDAKGQKVDTTAVYEKQ